MSHERGGEDRGADRRPERALDARLKKARAKAEAEDLKGRKAAEAALGKAVIDLLGDWKAIDPGKLLGWLADHDEEVRDASVDGESDPKAALARYRNAKRPSSRRASMAKAEPQAVLVGHDAAADVATDLS